MTEDNNESHAGGAGGENDFGHLFEQSMRAVRPGEIVKGRVVLVARDHVTVDIGYKSEGQIGIHEFRERDGSIGVKEGDQVERGQVVGKTGATGRVTAPHLHVAVRWQGIYLDPARLLKLALPLGGASHN